MSRGLLFSLLLKVTGVHKVNYIGGFVKMLSLVIFNNQRPDILYKLCNILICQLIKQKISQNKYSE